VIGRLSQCLKNLCILLTYGGAIENPTLYEVASYPQNNFGNLACIPRILYPFIPHHLLSRLLNPELAARCKGLGYVKETREHGPYARLRARV